MYSNSLLQLKEYLGYDKTPYQQLLYNHPDPIFLLSTDGYVAEVNRSLCTILGADEQSILYTHFSAHIYQDDLHNANTCFQKALAGAVQECRLRVTNVQGTVIDVFLTAFAIVDKGQVLGIYGMAKDITMRMLLQQRLRENEERFRNLVQNASDIIGVLDEQGCILYKSPSFERVLGYDVDDMLGTNAFDLVHPEDVRYCYEKWEELKSYEGCKVTVTIRIKTSYREWIPFCITAMNCLHIPGIKGMVMNYRPAG